jgi:hypothetical protein
MVAIRYLQDSAGLDRQLDKSKKMTNALSYDKRFVVARYATKV